MLFHDELRKMLAKYGAILPDTPNQLATPAICITRDKFEILSLCSPCAIDETGFDQVHLNEQPFWSVTYLFGHGVCLAHARAYEWLKPDEFEGDWLPVRERDGYICRYFRIGCSHPRMSTRWSRMHERHDACPDCHFQATYDTSG